MSEIEKMYRNFEIEKDRHCTKEGFCYFSECSKCDYYNYTYPEFTAEKQLSIVKFLIGKSVYYDTYGDREYWFHISDEIKNSKYREFDEAIAECINKMWEDLRDYEKVQIKEALK